MTINPDVRPDGPIADDVPVADAVEQQQQPIDISVEAAGLDPSQVTDLLQRDADPADLIDQAIIVPVPDEDREITN